MKTQPTEYHWCNDLSEFKRIICRGRRNQSTDYMKQPLKFVSWDKQHTFPTSETTLHDSHIYCTRCKEHNRADEIIKITKPDKEINVQNKPMKTSVKLATSCYKKTEGGWGREYCGEHILCWHHGIYMEGQGKLHKYFSKMNFPSS